MYQDRLRRLSGGKPYNPVAPIIEGIRLAHRNYPTAHPTLWDGLVDTGADITAIPEAFLVWLLGRITHRRLGVTSLRVGGIDWNVGKMRDAYPVFLQVPGVPMRIEVTAVVASRGNILLGRDVLSQLTARLVVDWQRMQFLVY